jgi:putative oxidoreductase
LNGVLLIVRIITGGYSIYLGLNQFLEYAVMTQYARNRGASFHAVLQGLAGFLPILGGISIATGFFPYVGMGMLITFLVPVTLLIHRFRGLGEAHLRMAHIGRFRTHMVIIGTILILLALPSAWSLTLLP